jgi:hypothetical protein
MSVKANVTVPLGSGPREATGDGSELALTQGTFARAVARTV